MIPHLVPEISLCDPFCDGRMEQQEQEELGILGVRLVTIPDIFCACVEKRPDEKLQTERNKIAFI